MKHASLKPDGFTLIELLVVMSIITVLASLTIATFGYANRKAGRDRATAEIAALSVALESYKIDNGDYPRSSDYPTLTDQAADLLDPKADTNATIGNDRYMKASLALYKALSSDQDGNRVISDPEKTSGRVYFPFKPNMLYPKYNVGSTGAAQPVTALIDPFRNSYGYSTKYSADLIKDPNTTTPGGYNPTFDLWSTSDADQSGATPPAAWITNW